VKLKDKRVIISGFSRGIGLAIATCHLPAFYYCIPELRKRKKLKVRNDTMAVSSKAKKRKVEFRV
jgi:NAD(P)-dependent dehydrogenase (short-subunit alcohol dehydrogenase family)